MVQLKESVNFAEFHRVEKQEKDKVEEESEE